MMLNSRKAFTMTELVFAIIVIGILSSIALPRFSGTVDTAYLSKAQSQLATVRSAIASERQKRILRGDNTQITDLGLNSAGVASGNAFDHFSADQSGNYSPVVTYPIAACIGTQRGCWVRNRATSYSFRFPKAADGQADFMLQAGVGVPNTFVCNDDNDADCQKIDY